MFTKTTRILLAGLSVGALGAGATLLQSPASAQDKATTIRLSAGHGQMAYEDLGSSGDGLGDTVVLTQPVRQRGQVVGHVHDVAVEVDAKRHLFQAGGSLVLAHGTIEFAGLVSQTPHFVLAVTGGTGAYQGASGRIAFDFPGKRQLMTVTLRH